MQRRPPIDPSDEAGDDDLDPEGPDESEMDFSDEPDLAVCPHCRRMISEEADRCPHCGNYISSADAPMSKRAWIVVAVVVALVLAFLATRI